MKFVLLLIGLLSIIPLRNALHRESLSVPMFWTATGLLLFLLPYSSYLVMSVISWPAYAGHTVGIELSAVDLLLLAYFFTLPKSVYKHPFKFTMAIYFSCVLASVFQASVAEPVFFYAWQLLRMFFVYLIVSRACVNPVVAPAILNGLALGLLLEGGMVVYQKFLGLDPQPNGTFPHQNFLGFVCNMVLFPILALNFANRVQLLFRLALLGGALVAVLTASRATLGLGVIGAVLLFCYSLACGVVRRTTVSALIVLVVVIPLVPIAISAMNMRAEQMDPDSDYDERAAFMNAAAAMVQDHPLGVGANNFVIAANLHGYYERAEVSYSSFSAHVHNLYYLTAAEIGYPGLLALLLMFMQPLILAFRRSWQHRGQDESLLLGGLGISLLIVYAHCYFEWIAINQFAQYFLAVTFGLVSGISMRLEQRLDTPV